MGVFIMNSLVFHKTCGACPEQYDVYTHNSYDELDIIGYVRLRWGTLSADCLNCNTNIYSFNFDDDMEGMFSSDEERTIHLSKIQDILNRHISTKCFTAHLRENDLIIVNDLSDLN